MGMGLSTVSRVDPQLGNNLGNKLRRTQEHSEALKPNEHKENALSDTTSYGLWSRWLRVFESRRSPL